MKSSNLSSFFPKLFWSLAILLFIGCQEKIDILIPKGDDGQVFAIDTGDSEIPYLVIDTQGASIPYEPGVPAQMKI